MKYTIKQTYNKKESYYFLREPKSGWGGGQKTINITCRLGWVEKTEIFFSKTF